MSLNQPRYVPAAGRVAFTGLYDRAMALTMRERRWRPALSLATLTELKPGSVVLDLGCGTATQALALARIRSDITIIGIDADPRALQLAEEKPGAEALDLRLGDARSVDLEDDSVDRVLLVLVLHHLPRKGKLAVLREARRCLRPDGQLHIVDWGRPTDRLSSAGFLGLQLLDGFAGTRDHRSGRWHELLGGVGFQEVRVEQSVRTPFGILQRLLMSPEQ